MTWLAAPPPDPTALRSRLRELVAEQDILVIPGTHDALSALIARRAGFSAHYLSGAAYTARRGLADVGITTAAELADDARDLVEATNLPVLVDADTGGGSPVAVARSCRLLADAGAAAIQIEDQASPKQCGHLVGKQLVDAEDMCARIRAARAAAPDMVLIARTDAEEGEGISGVVDRAGRYLEAGADWVFPEALRTREEFMEVRQGLPETPLLANMTEFGVSPTLTAADLQTLGYQAVIFPVSALRAAAAAVDALFTELSRTGTTAGFVDRMQTRRDLYDLIDYTEYQNFEDRTRWP